MKHEPYPLKKEQARQLLADNTHRLPWEQPDKVVIDRTMVGDIRQTSTFLDLLCVAYDLQPSDTDLAFLLRQEKAVGILQTYVKTIPYDDIEQVAIDYMRMGNIHRRLTWKQVIQAAYNLKPNE